MLTVLAGAWYAWGLGGVAAATALFFVLRPI